MCYAAHPVAATKQVICISSRPKPVCCMLWPLMMLAEPRIRHTDGHRSFSPTTHQSTWSFTKAFKIKFRSHEHPLAKLRMIIGVKDISKYQVSDEAEFPSWNYAWLDEEVSCIPTCHTGIVLSHVIPGAARCSTMRGCGRASSMMRTQSLGLRPAA